MMATLIDERPEDVEEKDINTLEETEQDPQVVTAFLIIGL